MAVTGTAPRSIFSERLQALMADIMAGNAPNAGRFCGYCYSPLIGETDTCDHCRRASRDRPPARRVPDEVLAMYRAQRSREGWAVRSIAYGGLLAGIVLGLLPIAFSDAAWWGVVAFFVILGFFYVAAANLANTVGDAVGYRWGQSLLQRRWEEFVAERDEGTPR